MKAIRVQRRRAKGWKMPANTIYVGRPTVWGNPFIVGEHGTAAQCVDLYRALLGGFVCVSNPREQIAAQERTHAHVVKHLKNLKGKNLACFCSLAKPCHADILLALANDRELPPTTMVIKEII